MAILIQLGPFIKSTQIKKIVAYQARHLCNQCSWLLDIYDYELLTYFSTSENASQPQNVCFRVLSPQGLVFLKLEGCKFSVAWDLCTVSWCEFFPLRLQGRYRSLENNNQVFEIQWVNQGKEVRTEKDSGS